MSGGQSLEYIARHGDPLKHITRFPAVLSRQRNCSFSFSGIKTATTRIIENEEEKHGII